MVCRVEEDRKKRHREQERRVLRKAKGESGWHRKGESWRKEKGRTGNRAQ